MHYNAVHPNSGFAVENIMSKADEQSVSPTTTEELPDDAPYQMPLKMTQADRRALVKKAEAARMSPTKWLIHQIHHPGGISLVHLQPKISVSLDRRRQDRAEVLAQNLGYENPSALARDLMHRALDDPKAAEQFLFGPFKELTREPRSNEKRPQP